MKRLLFLLAAALLALPSIASAKGPSEASIDGPGPDGGITFKGDGETGGTPLGDLTEQSGFFAAMFRQHPDPMLDAQPKGTLGPKYTITYTVPGPNDDTYTLKQDVYPYAKPGPLTYTKPGQEFFETEETRGGWYQAPALLKETLVSAGLPKIAPTGGSSDDGSAFLSAELLSMLAAALLLAGTATIVLRRRGRPAAAS